MKYEVHRVTGRGKVADGGRVEVRVRVRREEAGSWNTMPIKSQMGD